MQGHVHARPRPDGCEPGLVDLRQAGQPRARCGAVGCEAVLGSRRGLQEDGMLRRAGPPVLRPRRVLGPVHAELHRGSEPGGAVEPDGLELQEPRLPHAGGDPLAGGGERGREAGAVGGEGLRQGGRGVPGVEVLQRGWHDVLREEQRDDHMQARLHARAGPVRLGRQALELQGTGPPHARRGEGGAAQEGRGVDRQEVRGSRQELRVGAVLPGGRHAVLHEE
mmetsp:Transcript_98238/g.254052  ORF Transcript_98238/g.254052 Transcript_98238/m.254052 type:complete len:223 (-) Transcript_98238:528-1196(-)